jgi:hypothetical protein
MSVVTGALSFGTLESVVLLRAAAPRHRSSSVLLITAPQSSALLLITLPPPAFLISSLTETMGLSLVYVQKQRVPPELHHMQSDKVGWLKSKGLTEESRA